MDSSTNLSLDSTDRSSIVTSIDASTDATVDPRPEPQPEATSAPEPPAKSEPPASRAMPVDLPIRPIEPVLDVAPPGGVPDEPTTVSLADGDPEQPSTNVVTGLQGQHRASAALIEFPDMESPRVENLGKQRQFELESPARVILTQPDGNALLWVYAISAGSLSIGGLQAVRRIKQNRRALARRFVRIS